MEGLARICPRHSLLDWGNATAFDQQKLQNIAAFSDILSTLNNHSKLHADRWANFDENELCTPQNIKGDVYHRHMDNQVHAALKSHLVRGQDQRSLGRNYRIHGTPSTNTNTYTHTNTSSNDPVVVPNNQYKQSSRLRSNNDKTASIWCKFHEVYGFHTPSRCILNPNYCFWHKMQTAHSSAECSLNPANQNLQLGNRGSSQLYNANMCNQSNAGQSNKNYTQEQVQLHNLTSNSHYVDGRVSNKGSKTFYRDNGHCSFNPNKCVNMVANNEQYQEQIYSHDYSQNFQGWPSGDYHQMGLLSAKPRH